jgi:hypothetical protein
MIPIAEPNIVRLNLPRAQAEDVLQPVSNKRSGR